MCKAVGVRYVQADSVGWQTFLTLTCWECGTHPPQLLRGKDSGITKSLRSNRIYLTESVYKVVLQKSIPPPIRQLILHISNNEGQIDRFVRELTFAKRHYKHFL